LHALLEDEPNPDTENEDADEFPALTKLWIEHIKLAQQFIDEISAATFDNGNLDADVIKCLRRPEEGPVDISDPDIQLVLDLFMACKNSSQQTYTAAQQAIMRQFPESEILSYHLMKKLVADISGVVSIRDDMCMNLCHVFTGPFAQLDACSICSEPQYDPVQFGLTGKKVPQQQACTILLGPQIQALQQSSQSSEAMHYQDKKTQEILKNLDPTKNLDPDDFVYDDLFSGSDILDLIENLQLTSDNTMVSYSFDGAQLYQSEKSYTWIGIWVVDDYSPGAHYKKKHILPAVVVPGPNKPKNPDSFLF